jgi:uncharacterized membrane protein
MVRLLLGATYFTLLHSVQIGSWTQNRLLFNVYLAIFPRGRKAVGVEADRLPPSSAAKVERERTHASILPYSWLHAAHRDHLQQFN